MKVIKTRSGENIGAMCFDYRDKYLMYSDRDKLFRLNVETTLKEEIETNIGTINSIVSSKTTSRVIVSGKRVEVLDVDTGQAVWTSSGYEAGTKTNDLRVQGLPAVWSRAGEGFSFFNESAAVSILGDGETLLLGGHNKGNIEQIEIGTGRVVKTIFPAPLQAQVMSLGCKETILAVSARVPSANFVWDFGSGTRILPALFNEQFGGYSSLCLHPTERLIVSGSSVGFVSVQDLNTGAFAYSEQLHRGRAGCVLFAENPTIVFSGGDDGTVRIIEAAG